MNETVHQLEFLSEYTCNSQRVCHAIPSGILMLTPIGEICFTEKKGRNYKVRVLFLENIISVPPAMSILEWTF